MILGVLQARMSSTRLPGKVMADVLGRPMIARQLERLARARRIDRLVVATSDDPSDDALAAFLEGEGTAVHRGPLHDVLGRFAGALAGAPEATAVVRMTADCPLADPAVVDAVVALHHESGADYASNVIPDRTFPHGLDVEVASATALREAAAEAADPFEREHVTPFLYRRPERYRIECLRRAPSLAPLRWTVDLPADLAFVREVYAALYPSDPAFGTEAVAALPRNSAPIP